MGSKTGNSTPSAVRNLKRASKSSAKIGQPQACRRKPAYIGDGVSVSDKMEALKSLIPSQSSDIDPDQLFQETADYIVLLKTKVFVLQKLIDLYGSSQSQADGNAV